MYCDTNALEPTPISLINENILYKRHSLPKYYKFQKLQEKSKNSS